jgi:hypothetical protein
MESSLHSALFLSLEKRLGRLEQHLAVNVEHPPVAFRDLYVRAIHFLTTIEEGTGAQDSER